MKKLLAFGSGLGLLASQSYGAVTNNAAAVKTEIDGIVQNAEGVFDAIVPVVIAVVALGILISFAKMIKKR